VAAQSTTAVIRKTTTITVRALASPATIPSSTARPAR
jgi:hypothetical protein